MLDELYFRFRDSHHWRFLLSFLQKWCSFVSSAMSCEDAVNEVVWIQNTRDVYDGGFFRHLFGRPNALGAQSVRVVKDGTLEVTMIPPAALRCPQRGWGVVPDPPTPTLGLAAALALFDEVSSMAIVLVDKTHRAGTTITLSAHAVDGHEQAAGKVPAHHSSSAMSTQDAATHAVTVCAKVTKCGRTIGFAACELRGPNGELWMVGEHIKFLPTSVVWDWTVGWCRSLSSLDWVIRLGSSAGLINKTKSAWPSGDSVFTLDGATCEKGGPADGVGSSVVTASVSCTTAHLNPLGAVHGGLVAMALGEVAWLAASSRGSGSTITTGVPVARSMNVSYFSPTPRRFVVRAVAIPTADVSGGCLVKATVRADGRPDGRSTAEATLVLQCQSAKL